MKSHNTFSVVDSFSLPLVLTMLAFARLAAPARADEAPITAYNIKNIAEVNNGGRIVSVTSQLDDKYWKAANLIDGMVWDKADPKSTNGWASRVFEPGAQNFPQDIVIGFKDDKPKLVGKVVIDPTTPDGSWIGRWAREVELFASIESAENPASYKYVGTCKLINKGEPQVFTFSPVEAKYLKLRIRSNWGSDKYVSLGEIQVFEAIPEVGVLDQLIARLEQVLRDLKKYREENLK